VQKDDFLLITQNVDDLHGRGRLQGWGAETSTAQEQKSFFASFCSQKEALLFA
jgi:hypothetical protein